MRIVIAITGASGVQYGLRLIEILITKGYEIDLVISEGGYKVIEYEYKKNIDDIIESCTIYDNKNLAASIASGTYPGQAMVIIPCSMKTVAAIAMGYSQNLIQRAADCMLKENKTLVVVPRETPLNLIHLRNLVSLKEAGAIILPASPGFYYNPHNIKDIIDFIVGKVLNILHIEHELFKPWGSK